MIPWSAYWDRNYFLQVSPALGVVLRNNYLRGAISGLGFVDTYVGLLELAAIMGAWWRRDPDGGPSPADGRVA